MDDTKEFSYQKDTISYEALLMGTTKTAKLSQTSKKQWRKRWDEKIE